MKVVIENHELDGIVDAFEEASINKCSFNINSRVYNAGQTFIVAKKERDEERDSIFKPYKKEGSGKIEIDAKEDPEGFSHVTESLEKLFNKKIEVEFGEPIRLVEFKTIKKTECEISSKSQGILMDIGFLKEVKDE